MFLQTKISKPILKDLKKALKKLDREKEELTVVSCTKNGYQSKNIISLFKKTLLKKAIQYKDFYKHVFHIHYIEYGEGGYQELHSHQTTEDFSFIIYLNNSDGNTKFYEVLKGQPPVIVKPEEGRVVIFSSHFGHEATVSNKNKKVLVGAMFKK
jgi:hypothetical protein|tara:strand:+ start:2233 stop:2694 length:462 start_codon:yes stop_codon:yes gene_type:complete